MTPRTSVILAWLVRDTWRQSLASGVFWILLAISAISILVCASASVRGTTSLAPDGQNNDFLPRHDSDAGNAEKLKNSGVTVAGGQMSLAFGALQLPVARDVKSSVHFLELILAGGVADTLGLLMALIWTAGFLPGFLDGRAVSVLLAKPASRSVLLLGKYLGVLSFILAYAGLFVGGTWLAIALRTGVWDATYFWAIPILLVHFAIFFSVSLLLAVLTRSTVVCVFGSIVFWGITWSMNFGRHALRTATEGMAAGEFVSRINWLADLGYWILPKPADFGLLLFDALHAGDHFGGVLNRKALEAHGFSMTFAVLSSLAFAVVVLWAGVRRFSRADY